MSGPSTLTVAAPAGTNPVSYSLYDSDFITYWKYIGWDSPDQRWVTRHQGNITIDTSQPVFNVIGSLLDHFNGILSFEDGKFALSVETKKDSDKDLFWNFLSSPEGWSVTGGTLTSSEEYATISGAGVELEKAGLSFIGNENAVIKARIRRLNIGSWQGRVYYSTDTHGFSNSYYKDINVPTGFGSLNEWSIASWDMSDLTVGGNDYTNNFITGLAFDLGVNFDIEWISVGSSLRVIEQEDIVGSLTIKDEGLSKSYNSLSASIVDPANNFNTRSVSFFNSEYLKQDRGVVRSGSYQLEGITNYYNARLAVEQTLNRSRFSRKVSFTLRPVGLALSPGDIIRVKYPRFGWDTGKYFRIQSLTYQTNCMVSIVATEHDDSIYFIDAPKVSPYSVTRDFQAFVKVPDAPSNLEATNDGTSPSTEILDGIRLTWDKAASEDIRSRAYYEIHRSVNSDFTGAVKIATIPHNSSPTYLDTLQPTTRTSYYYKIRTANEVRIQTTNLRETKVYYSDFFPGTAVEGTTQAKFNNYIIPLYQKTTTNVAPTKPSNTLTYTFSTNSLSGTPDNGWSTTLPNNTDKYSWRIEQPVSSITDTVEISTWNEPSLFAEQGADGTGVNIVFIRKASVPTTPITASPGVPDDPEQWYDSPPVGTDILWASQGFKAVGETNYTWGDPYQVEGTAVAEIYQYRLNDASIDNSAQYNFVTNTFTPATNWSASPPSVSSNLDIVYVSVGLFIGGPTNTAATTTWSTPTVYAQRTDAQVIKLVPSASVINYSTAGTESDTIVFTTETQGMPAAVNYRWLVGTTQKEYDTNSGFTLAQADEPAIGSFTKVTVEARTGASPGTLVATDSVTIYAVQDGSDAITGFLTNASHVVAADSSGSVSDFTSAGGTFKVFVGGTDVTTSCTFSAGTNTNITSTIGATTGVYNITALSVGATTQDFTATIPLATAGTIADVVITASYSISKAIAGVTPDPLTVTSTVANANGTTTVNYSDGNSSIIGAATKIQTLYAASANPTLWSQVNTTGGDYVNFVEYTDTTFQDLSDAEVEALTFVKLVATDQGVIPVYADDDSGTNKNLVQQAGQEFILFYEWTGTKPTDASSVSGTWVKYVADPLTITSTVANANGTTTVNYSDGNSSIIGAATKIQTLYAASANPTLWSQVNTTGGDYVNFVEYTDTTFQDLSDAEVEALTFVKLVATDQGVIPVYADDDSGTNKNLVQQAGQEFILFYEWTGTKPTDASSVSGTWVKYVADPLTITSTVANANGTTTVNYSDGNSSIIGAATKIQTLYAASANPTLWSQVNTTGGDYVNFVEYTDTTFQDLSDAEVEALTFVKLVATDQGVIPVYADDDSGTNKNLVQQAGQEFILFYEWTGTKPTDASSVSGTWVKYVADPLTITSTVANANGTTTVNYSDGNSSIIGAATKIQTLYAASANPTLWSQVNTTGGDYVNFVEYTDTTFQDLSDAEVEALTFVKLVATDQGVIPVYADDATGTNKNLVQQAGQEFVLFYEWTGTAPTNASSVSGTWVKYVADPLTVSAVKVGDTTTLTFSDSTEATIVDGADSTVPGPDGLRSIQGYLYYEKTTANAPSAPAGTTYTFSTGLVSGTGIGTGVNTWTNEPRPQVATSSNIHYTLRYYGTEASASSTTIAVTYSSVVQYTNFTGVVTFSNGTFSSGSTEIDGSSDATSIDGGNIKTNSITATQIAADTITAAQLQISTEEDDITGIFMDGTNNSIKIFQGTTLRVRIGNLVDD